jgi:hypothetical protein
MDNEFMAQIVMQLDDMETRLKAAELALVQIPQINFETDPSRLPGVVVQPAALVAP